MPRAPRRCGYCKGVEHTRATCRDLEVDKILQMCGGQFEGSPETVKRHKIPFEKIAEVQLLIEGRLPGAIFKTNKQVNVARKYEIVIVKLAEDRTFEKQTLLYSEERWTDINNTWKIYTKTIKDSARLIRLIAEKKEKYLQKLRWLERDLPGRRNWLDGRLRPQDEFSTRSLHNLFHVDYVTEKERLLHEQTERNDRVIREYNQRQQAQQPVRQQQQAQPHVQQSGRWVNREPLPIISTKAFEAEDCPICMEPLGETSKVILRCGHQMCVTCMLTQTILAAKERNSKKCQCPHCREEYL
jgi:hypothetical protein